jgi:hypothetical protein
MYPMLRNIHGAVPADLLQIVLAIRVTVRRIGDKPVEDAASERLVVATRHH